MAAPSNGDGFGDDDDFEDFGGFEAADTMNLPPQASPQAVPNVWAAIVAPAVQGVSSVRPDLLCGQNRFPQHLDNPLTLDVAGSAQASVQRDDNIPAEGAIGDAGHPGEMDFANFPDTEDIDLDNINLANDILDGSFRSSTNQSGANAQSHGVEQLPDISGGLDLAAGISNNIPGVNANVEAVPNNTPPVVSAQNIPTENNFNIALDLNFERNNHVTNQQQAERNVSNEIVNNAVTNERRDQRLEENSLLQQANEEKERVQKEMEKQLEDNSRLNEDLARTQQLAESVQQRYNELQETHRKQLEDLRQAGHETLTVVVEEYKALLMTSLQQQQEMNEQSLCERLKIQSETFTDQLKSQQEECKSLLEEERKSCEAKFQQSLEEIKAKQKEEFNVLLSEERQKYKEYAQKEIEKEKEILAKEIQQVIATEQEKTKQAVESEQVIYQEKLDQAIAKHQSETEAALKEQTAKFQDELHNAVKEERVIGRESVQQTVLTVRDDMNRYLQEQREADRTVQRRHLTSLDLFLGSARNQLSILLDNSNTDDKKPSDADSNTPHGSNDT